MSDHPDLIENVLRFQKAAFAGTGLDPTLPPPATEEELVEVEQQLGFQLPEDLKTLYRFCGGGRPLGVRSWYPVRQLPELWDRDEFAFRDILADTPGPLNEGPGARNVVYCQGTDSDQVMVEVDSALAPGRVWSFFGQGIGDPWTLLASSMGEYWSNLAQLAEAGWYKAVEWPPGSVSIEAIEEVESYPKYVADLARLGLSHIAAYP